VQTSVTTDGQVIALPLRKAQCADCGIVQTTQPHEAIFSQLSYQTNYSFYDRPNMRLFDTARYRLYAEWVTGNFLKQQRHCRVLEIGCGAGWVLENLRQMHPDLALQGIEPSLSAVMAARAAGIKVLHGAADTSGVEAMHGQFDLVYSINVIEHTPDPAAFLRAMARFAKPEGTLCVICPDGDLVNIELLFLDHLYSIRRTNLCHLFEIAGIRPIEWSRGPKSLSEFQQLSGRVSDQAIPVTSYACCSNLLARRAAYFLGWQTLDSRLLQRLEGRSDVLCFGAGETSDVLKVFAPNTWEMIAGHIVDAVPREFRATAYRDRPLYYMDDPQVERYDTVLLGVKPEHQKTLGERLGKRFAHVICWHDIVENATEAGCEQRT
jgi:SAM-dependent methyltransferase